MFFPSSEVSQYRTKGQCQDPWRGTDQGGPLCGPFLRFSSRQASSASSSGQRRSSCWQRQALGNACCPSGDCCCRPFHKEHHSNEAFRCLSLAVVLHVPCLRARRHSLHIQEPQRLQGKSRHDEVGAGAGAGNADGGVDVGGVGLPARRMEKQQPVIFQTYSLLHHIQAHSH